MENKQIFIVCVTLASFFFFNPFWFLSFVPLDLGHHLESFP